MTRVVAGGAGLALLNLAGAEAGAQGQTPAAAGPQAAAAFRGQHRPKPLPFDPAKLKGLSEKLIRWEEVNRRFVGARRMAALI